MDCNLPVSSVRGISQQEYWSGFSLPSPGDLPYPGIEPESPAWQGGSFTTEPLGKSALNVLSWFKVIAICAMAQHMSN